VEGLLALAAGGEASAPSWRRSREELKALKVVPGASFGARPTISGPARGCPFLVDVRSSPAWRGSDVALEKVQTKGCSFCLDNVGAYAAFREEEVVGAWVSQLRAIRAAQPGSREILLTDEYPHRHLPALFRAIEGDPGLHGVELLIKSRVDWLAEHADGALSEACALAERSGSVLHLYLVGFESFYQPDLDLFNKAATVEENRRAVEILRELEVRFPKTFEFRRHRAHGILLFHPWTTPEGLLSNAHHLRESAFHELRSRALQTRLRLYPSVPLHELARAQGLLAGTFPEARGDRSGEQGYDASVPWRFADPRVEAIFQAADRLGRLLPELPEPDLLEMVVRFVLRWPAFAEAPGLAALPILQALFAWGALPAEVLRVAGPTVASFDREVEGVASGTKEACLKEGVAREDAAPLVEAYRTMGLAAAICSAHALGGEDGRHLAGDSHAIVAVARDEATLAAVLRHQRGVEAGDAGQIAPMGARMGYPPCCTAAFLGERDRGDNLALESLPFRRHPERPLDPRLNRLGAVSLLSHLLCSPDCAGSIALAEGLLGVLARLDEGAPRRILEHLAAPVLRLDYRRAALLVGAWQGDRFRLDELRPFAGAPLGIDHRRARSLRLRADGVIFDLDGEGPRLLPSPAPLLVEPGSPLAPAVRACLGAPRGKPRAQEGPDRPSSPSVPVSLDQITAALAPGTPVGPLVVERVQPDGQGGLVVRLVRSGRGIVLRVRPWTPERPAMSRRGSWALDLDLHGKPATEAHRSLLGEIALRLPGGGRGTGAPGSGEGKAAEREGPQGAGRGGVICTAPWTTLEVVDPDGRARQCCGDWTEGDRGDLTTTTLADLWNGPGYREARRIMGGKELGGLCRPVCPRLYDHKFAEGAFEFLPGSRRFEENQRLLREDIAERREVTRGQPLYVAVCPSTYCNYDCIMCMHGRSPRRELPESIWDELLAMLPTLRVLTLLGGEPLANPRAMQFLRAWDRQKTPDAAVSLVTNGSLLTPGVLAHLGRCRFGSVTVSLNAGNEEVYRQVQRGIALGEVLRNLDALLEHRRRLGEDFPVVLSFVVQPANHGTLLEFGELARSRGLPIRLLPLSPRGPDGLDFYDDGGQVAAVLASLDAFGAWAERAAPGFRGEILATRAAIAGEARGRSSPTRGRSLPLLAPGGQPPPESSS
jgi:MoaA/NifB/PqqE/SkfB family radical SAM enzyme